MFERSTGLPVVFSFGSTGLLARQLSGGAPFDLFAAAHPRFIDDVVAAGVCDPETRALYARGRLALWTRRAGALPAGVAELSQPRFRRIAIANPDHAPYGAAARHVLERTGIWEDVAPRVVLGDNVRQALQFAQTGNADAAIVALALVTHDADNPWMILDESLHPPIEQTLAVCTRGQQRAGGEAFARFVASDTGREVMRRFGFAVPSQAHGPGSAP